MITARRISAVLLAATLFASSVIIPGCSKKQEENKVSADDPWYSVTKTKIAERLYQEKDNTGIDSRFIGLSDDRVVFLTNGYKRSPEGVNEDFYDYYESSYYCFEIYGADGSLDVVIDIKSAIDDYIKETYKESANWNLMSDYEIKGNTATALIVAYLPTGGDDGGNDIYQEQSVVVSFDVNSGEITEFKTSKNTNVRYTEDSFDFDGYIVRTSSNFKGGDAEYVISVQSPDGSKADYIGNKLIPGANIVYIQNMLYKGDGKAIVCAYNEEAFGSLLYEMDLKTGKFAEYSGDDAFIKSIMGPARYEEGIGNVIVDAEGIKKVDLENKTKTQLFSFSDCNLNRSETLDMELLAMTEDRIYMAAYPPGGLGTMYDQSMNARNLFILTKEKTNPHAGKTIIRATNLGTYSYSVCEAVSVFNDKNADYFIKLDNDYSPMYKVDSMGISSWDEDYTDKITEATIDLTYQLRLDLINGEGPDIILGGAEYSHLNSADCMLDLKPGINTEGLFENIISACENDGKLFQCPLSFSVSGIVTSKDVVDKDSYGFTYDPYKEFVSDTCNGKDPVGRFADRTSYFINCLSKMQDVCWDAENKSYDTPAFRELAEFVSENVTDALFMEDSYEISTAELVAQGNNYEYELTFPYYMYFYSDRFSELKVLGAPSADGRGPSISAASSVGISANTKEKQACIDFVNLLLSQEIQESFEEMDSYTPVLRSAFEAAAKKQVDDFNESYHQNQSRYTRAQLMEYMLAWYEIDESSIDEYMKMIGSCKSLSLFDPALEYIIQEEIPAYFKGQKTLDEVIAIINDRTKTYLSENAT